IAPDARTVVVAAGNEILRSEDGGPTWQARPDAPGLLLGPALLAGRSRVERLGGGAAAGPVGRDADRRSAPSWYRAAGRRWVLAAGQRRPPCQPADLAGGAAALRPWSHALRPHSAR